MKYLHGVGGLPYHSFIHPSFFHRPLATCSMSSSASESLIVSYPARCQSLLVEVSYLNIYLNDIMFRHVATL